MFYFIGKEVIKMQIKKIFSCLLVAAMLLTAAPLSGFIGLKLDLPSFGTEASAVSLPSSGKCGENATYTFNEVSGLLTISGTGAIDGSAFEMHTEIRSVVIEDGITEIGDSAFNACVNIFEIKIPDSVTKIGKYIFDGCPGPLSITIPSSVTSISDNAFGSQKIFVHKGSYAEQYASENSLDYITLEEIPDDVGYVEGGFGDSFYWMVDKATETLKVRMNTNLPWEGDCAPWLPYKDYIKHVTSKGFYFVDNVFKYCDKLEEVPYAESISNLGKNAFYGCTSLKSVSLPKLKTIGSGAFYGCSGLTDVTISSNNSISIDDSAFLNCVNLKSITLPSNLWKIGAYSFYNCLQLSNVGLLAHVREIGDYAFANCKAFTALSLPDSVMSIGRHAFDGCVNAKELTLPCSAGLPRNGYAFGGCTNIEKITITAGTGTMQNFGPQGQSKIATYNTAPWYINREHLKEFTIADGITNIGDYAFCGFDKASQLAIPQTVTKIGASAFENCSELTSLEIPEGVTSIGASAFSGCSKLASVNIPKDITNIEASTFNGCSALTEIAIPSGVMSIGASAFNGCSGLTVLDIPTGVTAIGEAAFSDCLGIKKFTIPSGVIKIENSVFSGCSSLSDVNIHSGITSIGDNAFNGCSSLTASYDFLYYVDYIGTSSFAGCEGIDSLTVYNRKCIFGENSVAPNTTIYGFSNSTAETYANSNGNKFVSLDATHVHEYDYECDRICNICGFERDVDHAYDSACDDTCNYCGQKRKAPHVDDDVNYYCDVCGVYLLDIAIGEKKEVYVNAGEIVYLKFSPPYSGNFDFYSDASPNGTVGYVCDSEMNVLTRKEGYWATDDFYIETVLNKGKVYYLGVQFYDKGTSGTIPVTLSFYDEDHLSTHIEHKDSTCTEHGYDRVICDYCGKVISETELPFAHQYTSVVTPATCSEQGYTTYTCSLCSYSYKDNYTEALNHPTRSWHIEKNPTTSEEGLMVETCDLCSAKTNEMTIPKLRPDFVTGIELTPNKISMNIGETANITAVVTPTTAIDKSVIWSSSDNDIVSVDGGVVTAKAPGVAVITAETTDGGYKDFCIVRVASLVGTNGAIVDNENGVIYGFVGCPESIDGYVKTVDPSLSVQCNSTALGTGSVVSVLNGTKTVDSYKIVIFGDVDGDGWYDGRDAVTVSMLANGMLTREQVCEAAWIAADCNHDGIIDQLDVEILNQAGVLLSKVDQTKPTDELLETSAEYNEYISLIDQMNIKSEKPNDEPNEDSGFFAKLVSFIRRIIKFIVDGISKLFKF